MKRALLDKSAEYEMLADRREAAILPTPPGPTE